MNNKENMVPINQQVSNFQDGCGPIQVMPREVRVLPYQTEAYGMSIPDAQKLNYDLYMKVNQLEYQRCKQMLDLNLYYEKNV